MISKLNIHFTCLQKRKNPIVYTFPSRQQVQYNHLALFQQQKSPFQQHFSDGTGLASLPGVFFRHWKRTFGNNYPILSHPDVFPVIQTKLQQVCVQLPTSADSVTTLTSAF